MILIALTVSIPTHADSSELVEKDRLDTGRLVDLVWSDSSRKRRALYEALERETDPRLVPMLLDAYQFVQRSEEARKMFLIVDGLMPGHRKLSGDLNDWWKIWWARQAPLHPQYGEFKADLFRRIDPRFEQYFRGRGLSVSIRLDEVRWGGVIQDGIPPLRQPKMLASADADYLSDRDIVFGVEVSGDARAYPKRVLAWHEMFVDRVGGVPVTGVYCTLCESMILYESRVGEQVYQFGTSGFLWRSNKLMYDRGTHSLWNTLWGEPVHGPLANRDIRLTRRAVVTTSWAEWRRRHPDTRVLDVKTGHDRDYGEGVAYQDYLSTDRLMFPVPIVDTRLRNKAQILAVLDVRGRGRPLAVSVDYLKKNTVYQTRHEKLALTILTDRSGANRVYATSAQVFESWDQGSQLKDASGRIWTVSEQSLDGPAGQKFPRYPAHRAFWFGWVAAYPDTVLVK